VGLVERDLDLERGEDLRANLVADLVHVVERPGMAFRPHDARVARVGELGVDRELRAGEFHRARQAVAHAEQPADLAHVGLAGAQPERRAARGDEQPAQAGQFGDQLVRQGVRDGCIRSGITDQAERQHRDRRASGRCLGRRGGRRRHGYVRGLHVRHEAQALAMDRADEALRPAVVAERLARGLDAARDRGLRDDAPVPDLLDDLVAGHEPVAVLHEQREQREDLRLHGARRAARAQLHPGHVQLEMAEPVDHGPSIDQLPAISQLPPEISSKSPGNLHVTCKLRRRARGSLHPRATERVRRRNHARRHR
jgi:hypothetical protein